MIVKTALERGEWKAYTTTIDGVEYQACRFLDLKMKDFISTCGTAIPGRPRQTKHHGWYLAPRLLKSTLKIRPQLMFIITIGLVAVDLKIYGTPRILIVDSWQEFWVSALQTASLP